MYEPRVATYAKVRAERLPVKKKCGLTTCESRAACPVLPQGLLPWENPVEICE